MDPESVSKSKSDDAVPYGNSARELVASQEDLLYTLQNLQYELLKTDNETTKALEDIKCRIASVHLKSSRSSTKLSNANGNPITYVTKSPRQSSQQLDLVKTRSPRSGPHSSKIISTTDFKPRDYSTDLSSAEYASSVSFSDCDFSVSASRFSDETDSSQDESGTKLVLATPKRKKPLTILR